MSQQLGVDITKNVSMLQRGDTARFEGTDTRTELLPERHSSDRGHTDGQRHIAIGNNLSAGARNLWI